MLGSIERHVNVSKKYKQVILKRWGKNRHFLERTDNRKVSLIRVKQILNQIRQ